MNLSCSLFSFAISILGPTQPHLLISLSLLLASPIILIKMTRAVAWQQIKKLERFVPIQIKPQLFSITFIFYGNCSPSSIPLSTPLSLNLTSPGPESLCLRLYGLQSTTETTAAEARSTSIVTLGKYISCFFFLENVGSVVLGCSRRVSSSAFKSECCFARFLFYAFGGNCRLGYYSVITPSHTLRFEGPRENVPPSVHRLASYREGGEKKAGRVLL